MGLLTEACGPDLAAETTRSAAVPQRRSEAVPTPGPHETAERRAPGRVDAGWEAGAPAVPAGLAPRIVATLVDAVIVVIAWFVALWLFLEVLTLTGAF